MMHRPHKCRQAGLTYVEVLIAVALITIALVPAVDALYTGMLGSNVLGSRANEHYAALAKMEEVLAEPFSSLLSAAAAAGNESTSSSYSDAAGESARRLVYVALYDADNDDGDDNVFTVTDANLDGDNDPYSGYAGLLWLRTEIEGSATALESLVAR